MQAKKVDEKTVDEIDGVDQEAFNNVKRHIVAIARDQANDELHQQVYQKEGDLQHV